MPNIEQNFKPTKSITSSKPPKQKAINPNNIDSEIHDKILKASFRVFKEQSYADLWQTLKKEVSVICGDEVVDSIGDNKAKAFITYYLQNELIIKIQVESKVIYTINE